MFLERKEEEKPHKGSVFAGYDLGERYTQISYCFFEEGRKEGREGIKKKRWERWVTEDASGMPCDIFLLPP